MDEALGYIRMQSQTLCQDVAGCIRFQLHVVEPCGPHVTLFTLLVIGVPVYIK